MSALAVCTRCGSTLHGAAQGKWVARIMQTLVRDGRGDLVVLGVLVIMEARTSAETAQ